MKLLFILSLLSLLLFSDGKIVRVTSKGDRVCIQNSCLRESISNKMNAQMIFQSNGNYENAEYYEGVLLTGNKHKKKLFLEEGYAYLLDSFFLPKITQFTIAYNIIFDNPILVTIKNNNKIIEETIEQNYFKSFIVSKTEHNIEIKLTALTKCKYNPTLKTGFHHTSKTWLWFNDKEINTQTNTGIHLTNLTTLTPVSNSDFLDSENL